jgi:mono/diheme cytochrome c family protein
MRVGFSVVSGVLDGRYTGVVLPSASLLAGALAWSTTMPVTRLALRLVLCLVMVGAVACGDSGDTGTSTDNLRDDQSDSQPDAGKGGKLDAGAGGKSQTGSIGKADAGATRADASTSSGRASGLPCDVEKALVEHCGSCHGDKPLQPGMPTLVTFDGLHGDSITKASEKVSARVLARLDDPQSPMPPLSVAPEGIPDADKKLIEAYLEGTASRSDTVCSGGDKANAGDAGSEPAPDLSACDYKLELRAHKGNTADDSEGYQPPLVEDHYECFNFEVPFNETVQGIRFDPIIDDERVVHHWILYQVEDTKAPGSHGCGGTNRTFVNGWAPGGQPSVFPADIGLMMPKKGQTFQLEVHYNNPTSLSDVKDRSGVRVCATKTLRKNTAATFWLGSVFISLPPGATTNVKDTCTVPTPGKGPVTVMSTSPHMHERGTHMKSVVTHKDGTSEILVDKPFSFRDQVAYEKAMTIMPGDTISTTCTYKNDTTKTISFGEGTGDEMCFNFVTAYPIEGLGAGNRCMGLNPFAGALDGLTGLLGGTPPATP